MAGLPIIGKTRPTYINAEEVEKEIEIKTTTTGSMLACTEYTTSVFKKLDDQQAPMEAETPPRT